MRIFVFARHAESSANALRVINSDPSTPIELTAAGREQARRLGRQLEYLRVDRAICTRFLRTRQTASIALSARPVRIDIEPGLDEFDAGVFDGSALEPYWQWKEAHARNVRFPGGESLDDAARRYAAGFRNVLRGNARVTLVICHELALRYLIDESESRRHPSRAQQTIENAVPYLFDETGLEQAVNALESLDVAERDDGAATIG